MLCGINKKTGRCMKVENKKDSSIFCEVNKTVKQKRCRKVISTLFSFFSLFDFNKVF